MTDNEEAGPSRSRNEPLMTRKECIQLRLKQLTEQEAGIANETDEEYLCRRKEYDDEFDGKMKVLNDHLATQHRSVTRRTMGEFSCLQNALENEVNNIYTQHFKHMFKSFDEFHAEYVEALKKYEYLDDEIRQRNQAEGRPTEIHNLSVYNDDHKLREKRPPNKFTF